MVIPSSKLDSNNSDKARNNIHPLLVTRIINKLFKTDIKECKKVGYGKILVEFKDFQAANKVVDCVELTRGLSSRAPRNFVKNKICCLSSLPDIRGTISLANAH
ncbi:hypothetical protein PUN28_019687 [Cardiocondyla obscurior]|uniref:RRM domain-containing protein n=1 Tax=Cardiocondyla obscurior TaxID=286306 RepID=A0AAW2EFH7_9HYME